MSQFGASGMRSGNVKYRETHLMLDKDREREREREKERGDGEVSVLAAATALKHVTGTCRAVAG